MRRGNKPLRRSAIRRDPNYRIPRASSKKKREDAAYSRLRREYLIAHPFCQIAIAELGLDEAKVLERAAGLDATNCSGIYFEGQLVPIATEIHHRNKKHGRRRNDQRWWMSGSRAMHDKVEGNKDWARGRALLLPINADPDGRTPDGSQALTTPELMAKRAAEDVYPGTF